MARHRSTHFLVLAGALFAVTPAPEDPRRVQIAPEQLTGARAAEARRLGKAALSEEERREVDARVVEDALLYREASRLGLAEGDPIVMQRMTSKLLVLAEDVAGASQPLTEEQVRACHSERNATVPAEAELVHVFGTTREKVEALRTEVEAFSVAHQPGSIPPFGESFPLRRRVVDRVDRIAATYGPAFAAALATLPLGRWSEPLASKFGWHLVRLTAYERPRSSTEDGSRRELAFDCQLRVRERAIDDFLKGLFVKYDVFVGGEPLKSWTPIRRVAMRSTPSAEDR